MNHLIEFLKQNPLISVPALESDLKLPRATLLHAVSGRRKLPNKHAAQRKEIAKAMKKIYEQYQETANKIAEFLIIENDEKDM